MDSLHPQPDHPSPEQGGHVPLHRLRQKNPPQANYCSHCGVKVKAA
jgi:hypothetical protein